MPTLPLDEARAVLFSEWEQAAPHTPSEIADFYQHNAGQAEDLDAWHETPERQGWTRALVFVAQQIGAQSALDIGCGMGHDLKALKDFGLTDLVGIEPNDHMSALLAESDPDIEVSVDIHDRLDLHCFDLISCFDVLEHIPDPESFLDHVARRAKVGAFFVETTATSDVDTPLHLEANWGWHPGRVLERNGWVLVDTDGRLRVWQRVKDQALECATLLLCAYRGISIPTMHSVLQLAGVSGTQYEAGAERHHFAVPDREWRVSTYYSDGLISRARSRLVSRWWAETADDVFLMIDDDIVFGRADAERIIARCRAGHDIICAAYPVRDGSHLAQRGLSGRNVVFGPDEQPSEIQYAATGFLAVHRRVIDAMVPTLPLCHPNDQHCFWPFFAPSVAMVDGYANYLSEDWAFTERAKDLGFKIWLDPTIKLGHLAHLELNVNNMDGVASAIQPRRVLPEGGDAR